MEWWLVSYDKVVIIYRNVFHWPIVDFNVWLVQYFVIHFVIESLRNTFIRNLYTTHTISNLEFQKTINIVTGGRKMTWNNSLFLTTDLKSFCWCFLPLVENRYPLFITIKTYQILIHLLSRRNIFNSIPLNYTRNINRL